MLDWGEPLDSEVIITLNRYRNQYIKQRGLKSYLSEMLGPLAVVRCQYCRIYQSDGTAIEPPELFAEIEVQRYIATTFTIANLPYKVETEKQVRYL